MIFQFSNFVQVWHFNGIWIDWIDECFRGHLVAGEMKQLTDFWWNFIAARFATGNGCDHVDGATPATRLVRDRILIGFLVYFQVICIRSMGPRWIVFSAPPPVCYLCLFVRETSSVSGVQGDKWKRGGGVHWKLNSRESHRRPGPREKVANRLVVCFYCQRTTRGTGRDHPVDPPPRSRSSFIFLSAFIRRLTNINTRSWWNRHNCHDWSHSLKRVESGYPDLSIFLELAHDKT